jgi:threonine aldolase
VKFNLISRFTKHESARDELRALLHACEGSIDKDIYGVGDTVNTFEASVAAMLDKESAMFCISGVMAQQIALKMHSESLGGCNKFVIHPTSHLELHEQQSYKHVMGLEAIGVGDPKKVLTFADIKNDLGSSAIHLDVQVATIVIELPQRENGGVLVPWDDLIEIKKWCQKRGVRMHCDGTRLWGTRFHYQKSYAEICALFDTVFVSFYKELGGMCGGMLLGEERFIDQARIWLRRMGGNVCTTLPYVVSCQHAFRTHLPTFINSIEKIKRVVALLTDFLTAKGYAIWFDPPVPETPMVHTMHTRTSTMHTMHTRTRTMHTMHTRTRTMHTTTAAAATTTTTTSSTTTTTT